MDLIKTVREALANATPGPWAQGNVSGQCRMQEHATSRHPGYPHCQYEYRINTERPYDRRFVSVAPNVTLIGSDDNGPILDEADAHLIANAPTWLAQLADEVARLDEQELSDANAIERLSILAESRAKSEATQERRAEAAEAEVERWSDNFDKALASGIAEHDALRAEVERLSGLVIKAQNILIDVSEETEDIDLPKRAEGWLRLSAAAPAEVST